MRVVITGAGGTIGRYLTTDLLKLGHEIIPWDRHKTAAVDYSAMQTFLRSSKPFAFYHLAVASHPTGIENESWLINVQWPRHLAKICRELNIRFIFTSTVMVFSEQRQGPFTINTPPDAANGYGFEKRTAEELVLKENPDAIVLRLGWQIGDRGGSNNMIDYLEKEVAEKGVIKASQLWLPACSFITDTVTIMTGMLNQKPGLYMLDANKRWNFYQICCALNRMHGNRWQIVATDDFVYDQRMIDTRLQIPDLNQRLKDLP